MKRLTLAGQMAMLIALCLMIAMAINFVTLVRSRQNSGLEVAVIPAAQKLANAVYEQSAIGQSAGKKHTPSDVSIGVPRVGETARLPKAEEKVGQILAENRLRPVEVRAFHTDASWRAKGILHLSAKLDDGRWITIRSPGPYPLGPTMARLLLQMAALYALIIIPALFVLRRANRALNRLDAATLAPMDSAPVPVDGPRDIQRLTESFNSMKQRISAMIEERNVMLGAIGHDLRTPLTALRLEVEGIADPTNRDVMIGHIESLSDQFEQILLLAREGQVSGPVETVDLAALARRVVEERFSGQDVWIATDGTPGVIGNRVALARLIGNLVDNALRYGGNAEVKIARDNDRAALIVEDRGPGIPAQEFEEALKPFGRLEPSRNVERGGHGLGLAIAAQVTRSHQGSMELGTVEPHGLRVTVLLPLAPADAVTKLET